MFVMGGAQIYREFLPHIEQWIITEVPLTIDGADAFMPDDYLKGFKRARSQKLDEELVVKFYAVRSLVFGLWEAPSSGKQSVP